MDNYFTSLGLVEKFLLKTQLSLELEKNITKCKNKADQKELKNKYILMHLDAV